MLQCLRDEVAEHPGFEGWERALFHIDEAISWESVRNLRQMQRSLILVRNLLHQGDIPDAVAEVLDAVSERMDERLKPSRTVTSVERVASPRPRIVRKNGRLLRRPGAGRFSDRGAAAPVRPLPGPGLHRLL